MGGTDDPSNLIELTVEEQVQKNIKNDPIRQQAHSQRMKKWWYERRKVGT